MIDDVYPDVTVGPPTGADALGIFRRAYAAATPEEHYALLLDAIELYSRTIASEGVNVGWQEGAMEAHDAEAAQTLGLLAANESGLQLISRWRQEHGL